MSSPFFTSNDHLWKKGIFARGSKKNLCGAINVRTFHPDKKELAPKEFFDKSQGCQIFLGTTYQNGKKYTKLP
jgi:hypothetical protein